MSHRSVCRWVAKFIISNEHLKDADRQGRPATVTTKHYIVEIHQILQKDVRYIVRQLAQMTNLSLVIVSWYFEKKNLMPRKINARLILLLFSN